LNDEIENKNYTKGFKTKIIIKRKWK